MMNSHWPDFKREIDKIPVPTEKLDSIIKNMINEKRTRKAKKKIAAYSLSAAVLLFGLFVGSAAMFPAMANVASQLPLIGTFFNDIDDEGLKIAGREGLTQVVNQTAKDNGITLTINEIFYDGTRLTLGYTHESLLAIGEIERPTIEVDGKEINFSSSYSGKFVTPQKYKGIMEIRPAEELPEEFQMKITIDAVGFIPGKWEFAFPVKQSNEVTVIRPETVKKLAEAEMEITSLKMGPAGTDLAVKVKADENQQTFDPYRLDFYLVDENENIYDFVTKFGYGDEEKGEVRFDILYTPLKEGVKKVKIVPYLMPMYSEESLEEVSIPLDEQNVPFILDQGEFGKIAITKIFYFEDWVEVYFDVQSDVVIDNKLALNPIWLEDAKGKKLFFEDAPFAERIEGNHFKQQFPIKKKEGLQLKTFKFPKPIIFEPVEIEIP